MGGANTAEEHPARAASRRSMDAVHRKDKRAWLDNFAPDAVVEDPGGSEVANVGSITTVLPGGAAMVVQGVFTYRVDSDGRVVALRAFWEPARLQSIPAPTTPAA